MSYVNPVRYGRNLILATLLLLVPVLAATSDSVFDDLLKEYRALGLPLPPEDAKLVRYDAGGGGIINRVVQPIRYGLAFEFKPKTKTEFAPTLRDS